MNARSQLKRWLLTSGKIVVISGAGISTESGIPDFRSEQGIWQDDTLIERMSDFHLKNHPNEFWPAFKATFMRPEYLAAKPNAAHLALARLEEEGPRVRIYTQNVDGLHRLAGSQQVFEMHGSIRTARCPNCGTEYGVEYVLAKPVPHCGWETPKGAVCGAILHPDTVLFGQSVRHFHSAAEDVISADLVLVIGTSLTVEPVASLPRMAENKLAIVNLSDTDCDERADVVIHERAGEVLGQLIEA